MSKDTNITENQLEAAKKSIEWMERSKPSVAARSSGVHTDGIALPPHTRNCGRAHPMQGTNSEDLTRWCMEHET